MRKRIQVVVLFLGIILSFSSFSFKHPVKLTSTQIKYDLRDKSLSMECKVFIDDFTQAFNNEKLFSRMTNSNLTDLDQMQIENYFIEKFKVSINGKILPLKFESYVSSSNVMTITFSKNSITLAKGDTIYIENELLFEEFQELQSNWITLLIPPFIKNHNFTCDFENYSYSHTF